jgi:hypothetical protein
MDPAGGHLEHEQDIQPLQQDGVHGEEVHGQHTRGLGAEKLPPRDRRARRCGNDAGAVQDGPHRAAPDPEAAQLTVDAAVAPGRILPGQPQHQRPDLCPYGGTATPVWVAPAASDQVAVPAQQRFGPDE